MSNKEAQVNWDDDDFLDIDECHEKTRQLRAELAQARAELTVVDEALDEFCNPCCKDHGVYAMRQNLNRARSVVAARNIELTRALNECAETEVKLARACAELAALDKTVDQLLDRLTTLDAAEAALAGCGIGGIYDGFAGLADAITQMAEHIKELMERLAEAERRRDYLLSMTEYERRLRGETERRAENAEALVTSARKAAGHLWGFWDGNSLRATSGFEDDIRKAWDELLTATGTEAAANLPEQRAEALETKPIRPKVLPMESSIQPLPQRSQQCAIRAEARAALVTPELAALLENMASCCREYADVREPGDRLHPSRGYVMLYREDAKNARTLAAQIREALDDSQT